MAGHGHGQGQGHGNGFGRQHNESDGGPLGGIGNADETNGQEDAGDAENASMGHGRSEQSPGHMKRAAGAQSARDFAPGRARRS